DDRGSGARLAVRDDPPDGRLEGVEVDRLGQVGDEPGLAAAAEVVVGAEAGQGDPGDAGAGVEPAHQVQAAAVGQAEVADDQVERLAVGRGQAVGEAVGRRHAVAD